MLKFFTIQDTKAGAWNHPFPSINRATAQREMTHKLNSEGASQLATYAVDFRLFETGEFDEQTGIMVGHPQPIYICDLSDLIEKEMVPIREADSVEDSHGSVARHHIRN